MPRIDVWTEKKISAAIQQDLLPSLDYGKLKVKSIYYVFQFSNIPVFQVVVVDSSVLYPCLCQLLDVAYEERHPWEPRDTAELLEVRVGNEVCWQ